MSKQEISIETQQFQIDESLICLQFDLTSSIQRKNKQIVVALDISGSMSGEGINQAKIAIGNLFNQLDNEDVVLITYDTSTETFDLRNKSAQERQSCLSSIYANGGTDFSCAFKTISELDMFNRDSEVAILFFTDGQDGSDNSRASELMKNSLQSKTQSFEFHTIGFTSSHDVQLLTRITQLGSVQGTFQYVKDAAGINESMENLLGILTSNSTTGYLSIKEGNQVKETVKVPFTYQEERGKYIGYGFIDIGQKDFTYSIEIQSEVLNIVPIPSTSQVDENDPTLIKIIIKYIEKSLLDITTKISNNTPKETLNEFFIKGKKLQDKLAIITFNIQRMKNRILRRDLYTFRNTIHDTLVKFNEILSSAMIGNFSNDKLATLNDIAYRSVTNQCLKKKLDMRKQDNASVFKESENLIEEYTNAMNFEEMNEKYKDSIEKYGSCIISCQNWIEALQDRDCLCIALDVVRPEKAIKDPSLVEIKSVSATMMTAESFLDSVLFSLENTNDQVSVHGGFSDQSGTVLTGTAKENISGVFPLYISEEHWKVAKEKMKGILGYIATLEPLGYMKEQLETIPFLVLVKSILSYNQGKTEFTKHRMQMILETCSKILEELNEYDTINKKLLEYNQDVKNRLPETIPNNQIFLAKVLCSIIGGKVSGSSIDWKLFFQNMMEEDLRRVDLEKTTFSETEICEILQLNSIIDAQVQIVRKKMLEKKDDKEDNQYISKMKKLLESTQLVESDVSDKPKLEGKSNHQASEYENESRVEFSGKIPGLNTLASNLVSKLNSSFIANVAPFIKVASEYLKVNDDISDIYSMVKSNAGLVCLLVQSVNFQNPNKKKTAIEKGEYLSPFNETESIQFVKSLANSIISKKISSAINQLINDAGAMATINQFIYSDNELESAGVFHGNLKGSASFHTLVSTFESTSNIPLVKEKIKMLISGYYKHVQLTLDKDGPEWAPKNRFCFRVWKNNKSAFENQEEVFSTFGDKYREYLITVMRMFRNQ